MNFYNHNSKNEVMFEKFLNWGIAHTNSKNYDEALKFFRKVISLKPKSFFALKCIGDVFKYKKDYKNALYFYHQSLRINPNYVDAINECATILKKSGDLKLSLKMFEKSLILKDSISIQSYILSLKMQMCEWDNLGDFDFLKKQLKSNDDYISPFSTLAVEDNPKNNLKRSKIYVRNFCNKEKNNSFKSDYNNKLIKIGYFSSDFYDHATLSLMADLPQFHNKKIFSVHAYCYGKVKKGKLRDKFIKYVDTFVNIENMSDKEIKELVKHHQIDIAIDLKGYTNGSRINIFSQRIVPIQINYLGYPSTMGADFIDYIIADKTIIPVEQRKYYSEKIIYLPNSYQPNNLSRVYPSRKSRKSDFGIPSNSFVFANFNNSYKITKKEFEVWIRVLENVNNSVLWLFNSNKWMIKNLSNEAKVSGIDPNRLIFANPLPYKKHLERLRHIDLFLDTFNCNAHTTASDALWMEVPVLTKIGKQFAARVCASLLYAVNLPELVTKDVNDYIKLAIALGKNKKEILEIKRKLKFGKSKKPLFDTKRYTKNFEKGLLEAFFIFRRKEKPVDIYINE